jgi:hypothetical protein
MKHIFLIAFAIVITACSAHQTVAIPTITATPTLVPPTVTPLPPTETSIPPTLTPTKEIKNFNICLTKANFKNCPITQADVDNRAFLKYATENDQSGAFDMSKVVFYPIGETSSGEKNVHVDFVGGIPGLPDIATVYNDPSARFMKVMSWGYFETDSINHYGWMAAAVKYINPDGSIIHALVMGDPNYGFKSDTFMLDGIMLPVIQFDNPNDPRNDPEVAGLLRQWINSIQTADQKPVMPMALDGKTLWSP